MSEDETISILFVCMGNICRSPTAEGVMLKHLADSGADLSVRVDSAGTHAYHAGEPPDARAVEAALRRGIDISEQTARPVESLDFDRFDLLLAMDVDNLAMLEQIRPKGSSAQLGLMLDYSPAARLESVPDPYYGGTNGFERVLDMLEDACQGLIKHLRNC